MSGLDRFREIVLRPGTYDRMIEHARRKLQGGHLPGEEPEAKAYGLVAGCPEETRMVATHAFALRRNLRHEPPYRSFIDQLMEDVAVPSETPFDRRGWVADPSEVRAAEHECEPAGSMLFGGYHMHRVPWDDDPLRDRCTLLDTRLAEGSGLWVLILSMVDPVRPRLRAFFEGRNEREAAVRVAATPEKRP